MMDRLDMSNDGFEVVSRELLHTCWNASHNDAQHHYLILGLFQDTLVYKLLWEGYYYILIFHLDTPHIYGDYSLAHHYHYYSSNHCALEILYIPGMGSDYVHRCTHRYLNQSFVEFS